MRYFFMAEPIRAMEGDLLGVEITTHFASSPARPLHPEFVISSWDNSQKRRFLLDLLRTADNRGQTWLVSTPRPILYRKY